MSKQASGSLLLAWQVKDKHCLVIGSGEVALSRINHLIVAQAKITVITGLTKGVHPSILDLNKQGKLYRLIQRNYDPAGNDLTMYEQTTSGNGNGNNKLNYKHVTPEDYSHISRLVNDTFACVCCCIDDYELSTKIYYQCKLLRLAVNIADKPPLCDFYFGSMINQDNLQIMISTNGKSPRLSKMIKDNIANEIVNIDLNRAIENLALIRSRLRKQKLVDDDLVTIETRMNWIKTLTDFFTLKQWSVLTFKDSDADKIIGYFPEFPPRDYQQFKEAIFE
ncbi:uncharacterized protein LODBEIA_P31650 [Lodderomyces beijingensis]|uniref:precorrin-2 dehydrogenase n=1 Tax=Lodderomyces beijingensis TaxID=1775926 RepID=A0ABP0ZPU7_9ASCO